MEYGRENNHMALNMLLKKTQFYNHHFELECKWFNDLRLFSLLVYLRTTPEVVYERMKVRGRSEEDSVSLDYLKQLHDLHEDWLIHGRKHRPAPVIFLIFVSFPTFLSY